MTNDLISREALLKKSIRVSETDEGGWERVLRAVPVEEIEKAEAVDAAPVVHGRWEDTIIGTIKCTLCGGCYNMYKGFAKYCPNCGAKMDLEE